MFVGKDVATALGYAKPQNALATHVDKEDKSTAPIQGTAYETRVTLINESGLYALILSSKLPQAKAFKRWVTSEVLPQILYRAYLLLVGVFASGGGEHPMQNLVHFR